MCGKSVRKKGLQKRMKSTIVRRDVFLYIFKREWGAKSDEKERNTETRLPFYLQKRMNYKIARRDVYMYTFKSERVAGNYKKKKCWELLVSAEKNELYNIQESCFSVHLFKREWGAKSDKK